MSSTSQKRPRTTGGSRPGYADAVASFPPASTSTGGDGDGDVRPTPGRPAGPHVGGGGLGSQTWEQLEHTRVPRRRRTGYIASDTPNANVFGALQSVMTGQLQEGLAGANLTIARQPLVTTADLPQELHEALLRVSGHEALLRVSGLNPAMLPPKLPADKETLQETFHTDDEGGGERGPSLRRHHPPLPQSSLTQRPGTQWRPRQEVVQQQQQQLEHNYFNPQEEVQHYHSQPEDSGGALPAPLDLDALLNRPQQQQQQRRQQRRQRPATGKPSLPFKKRPLQKQRGGGADGPGPGGGSGGGGAAVDGAAMEGASGGSGGTGTRSPRRALSDTDMEMMAASSAARAPMQVDEGDSIGSVLRPARAAPAAGPAANMSTDVPDPSGNDPLAHGSLGLAAAAQAMAAALVAARQNNAPRALASPAPNNVMSGAPPPMRDTRQQRSREAAAQTAWRAVHAAVAAEHAEQQQQQQQQQQQRQQQQALSMEEMTVQQIIDAVQRHHAAGDARKAIIAVEQLLAAYRSSVGPSPLQQQQQQQQVSPRAGQAPSAAAAAAQGPAPPSPFVTHAPGGGTFINPFAAVPPLHGSRHWSHAEARGPLGGGVPGGSGGSGASMPRLPPHVEDGSGGSGGATTSLAMPATLTEGLSASIHARAASAMQHHSPTMSAGGASNAAGGGGSGSGGGPAAATPSPQQQPQQMSAPSPGGKYGCVRPAQPVLADYGSMPVPSTYQRCHESADKIAKVTEFLEGTGPRKRLRPVELLVTLGLLQQGERVHYRARDGSVKLYGTIRGTGILCDNCCQLVGCTEFEKCAGSALRRPTQFIYNEHGETIQELIEKAKSNNKKASAASPSANQGAST